MFDFDELEINVCRKNKYEEDVTVEVDINQFWEHETPSEKIDYVKSLVFKKIRDDKAKVRFYKADLKDFISHLSDKNDTSNFHPNESYDEFMEHEDY